MKGLAVLATVQFPAEVEVSPECREHIRGDVRTAIVVHLQTELEMVPDEQPFTLTVGIGTPEWADDEVSAWGEELGKAEITRRVADLLVLALDAGFTAFDLGKITAEATRQAAQRTAPNRQRFDAT